MSRRRRVMPDGRFKGRLAAARETFLAEHDRTTLADCADPTPIRHPDNPDLGSAVRRSGSPY